MALRNSHAPERRYKIMARGKKSTGFGRGQTGEGITDAKGYPEKRRGSAYRFCPGCAGRWHADVNFVDCAAHSQPEAAMQTKKHTRGEFGELSRPGGKGVQKETLARAALRAHRANRRPSGRGWTRRGRLTARVTAMGGGRDASNRCSKSPLGRPFSCIGGVAQRGQFAD